MEKEERPAARPVAAAARPRAQRWRFHTFIYEAL